MLKFTSLYAVELPLKIWLGGKLLIPSTSGATMSSFKFLAFSSTSFHLTWSWMHCIQLFIFINLKSSFISVPTHIVFWQSYHLAFGEHEWKKEKRHEYGESKTTRIMMATVRHVTAWAGRTKYQAAWVLLNRMHNRTPMCNTLFWSKDVLRDCVWRSCFLLVLWSWILQFCLRSPL